MDRLQELQYIATQTGTDLDTMTLSMSRLMKSMDTAKSTKSGPNAAAEAFDLGIKIYDANGNLRDSRTVWAEAIAAIGKIHDPTEADAIAMQLFGKSALELNPLIDAGTAKLDALASQAHAMGAVMSTDAVQAAADLKDKLDSLQSSAQGIVMTLAGALVPGLSNLATSAQGYAQRPVSIIGMMKTDPAGAKKLLTGLVSDIVAQIPVLLKAGLAIIQGLITAIISALPTLIDAAMQIITSLVQFIITGLPGNYDSGAQPGFSAGERHLTELPALIKAAVAMIVTLVQGIADALPQLMVVIATIIPQVMLALVGALPALIGAALQLIIALVNGLVLALPILIQYAPQILWALINAVFTSIPLLATAAVTIINALIVGLISMLPLLGTVIPQLLDALGQKGIEGIVVQLGLAGATILQGIYQGILDQKDAFDTNITAFWNNFVAGIKLIT